MWVADVSAVQGPAGYLPRAVHAGEGVLPPVLVKTPLRLLVQGLLVVVLINTVLHTVATCNEQ